MTSLALGKYEMDRLALARFLGVSRRTADRWTDDRKLRTVRRSNGIPTIYDVRQVLADVKKHRLAVSALALAALEKRST